MLHLRTLSEQDKNDIKKPLFEIPLKNVSNRPQESENKNQVRLLKALRLIIIPYLTQKISNILK